MDAPALSGAERPAAVRAPPVAAGSAPLLLGLGLLCALLAAAFEADWAPPARWALFDVYQRLMPRHGERLNALVIGIDEEAIAVHGPWPWPRDRLATLLERLAEARPAVIGMDMLFNAMDVNDVRRLATEHGAELREALRTGLLESVEAERLEALVDAAVTGLGDLPSSDEALEFALFAAPVVLARRAALDREVQAPGTDVAVAEPGTALQVEGPDPRPHLPGYRAMLGNLPRFEAQARGVGFISVGEPDADGVLRRVPLLVRVGEAIVPSMAVEMLRVALRERGAADAVVVESDRHGVVALRVGPWRVRTDRTGALRPHFGPPAFRQAGGGGELAVMEVSAATVLGGAARRFEPAELGDTLLLVGVTGLGGVDVVATPVDASARGVYVHAEVIENIIAGSGLRRPGWMVWLELALALALVAVLSWLLPRAGRLVTAALVFAALAALLGLSLALFAAANLLLSPLLPGAAALAATGVVRGALFASARRAARELGDALQRAHLEQARTSGELDAARDIQLGLLPDVTRLAGLPPTVQLHALLRPARQVGGDLYDAFMIDAGRLFFVIGDVAGKGVAAALFMALGKTLCKSNALRGARSLEALVCEANQEISRDNPGEMFITAVFGVLDCASGVLGFCNAGHDAPLLLGADGAVRALDCDGGPPLCMLEDFPYLSETVTLAAGESLVLVTDGVGEAHDPDGNLYGRAALQALLRANAGAAPAALVAAIDADVARHAAGAEPFDDLTVLVLRYQPR